MPPMQPKPEIDKNGRFIDSGTGLLVPATYKKNTASIFQGTRGGIQENVNDSQLQEARNSVSLHRNQTTFAVQWSAKGSGLDDRTSEAIVDGRIANVGVSPVVAPQISAMVRREVAQASTASIEITGKQSPFTKAREAIARFNDSPLGVSDALETIAYRMCTYNRGSPVATVPIVYDFDTWGEYGLNAIPILAQGEKEEHATKFYLEVDWAKWGQPVPYLPSPFDLEPTDNTEYPYWYRVRREGQRDTWVLLHSSHIIPLIPGKSAQAGIGTSAVWMCLGVLAEQILVSEERTEKMLYSLTDGLLLLGGVNINEEKIEQKIEKQRDEAMDAGFTIAKRPTIVTSPIDKVSIAQITFRQPSGIPFTEWREYVEDVIASCFNEPLSALVTRGGVGYGAQAEEVADMAAETGVGSILYKIGSVLGAMYPRVMITVSRANNRASRLEIKTLTDFASAAAPLIDRGVITPEQAQAIIDRDIIAIPEADAVTSSANPDDSTDDDGSGTTDEDAAEDASMSVEAAFAQFETLFSDGDVVITDEDVDEALNKAEENVDENLFDLLNAVAIEDEEA